MTDSKRYQVFLSSTFTDLQEERRAVMHTLMEMDCIPAGMELFPAADIEQMTFIQKIIDDCDYYVLIIGARYGNVVSGMEISFTEAEYDYAISSGKKICAFLHAHPEKISNEKSEKDPTLIKRLEEFRFKISQGRLVRHWNNSAELQGLVSIALHKTITLFPAVGWVRGDRILDPKILQELELLRIENARLTQKIKELAQDSELPPHLVGGTDVFDLEFKQFGNEKIFILRLSWDNIFNIVYENILREQDEFDIGVELTYQMPKAMRQGEPYTLARECLRQIRFQFEALGLISTHAGRDGSGNRVYWSLTARGRLYKSQLVALKRTLPTGGA